MPRGMYDRRRTSDEVETAEAEAPQPPVEGAHQPVSARAGETRRERRRRSDGDLDGMARMRLNIPHEVQQRIRRDGKVVRYFLESNIPDAYANDWDRVEGVDQVLANPTAGEQDRLILCEKYKDWHEADLAADEQVLSDRDARIMAGQVPGTSEDGRSSAGLHVPKGQTNRISRQRGL